MDELELEERQIVEKELEGHLATMRNLKSRHWGGPSGIVVPPYRVLNNSARPLWSMKIRDSEDLVFCHNDFSTHNVLVDPKTLKVNAILDWEYAGFFPQEFEGMYFRRPGPSVALGDEAHDEDELLSIMNANCLPL
ncbi:Protein kinase-like (PK-like) [Glarea lozoyensis ATCC 20868]|nr:Protein kinase-like (PK-like) [Glarea lozoyensis ATCC 20868]EPE29427.1 Protein kinase-like (PK-like) [Glarea lozoyensis ATCC 20868]